MAVPAHLQIVNAMVLRFPQANNRTHKWGGGGAIRQSMWKQEHDSSTVVGGEGGSLSALHNPTYGRGESNMYAAPMQIETRLRNEQHRS